MQYGVQYFKTSLLFIFPLVSGKEKVLDLSWGLKAAKCYFSFCFCWVCWKLYWKDKWHLLRAISAGKKGQVGLILYSTAGSGGVGTWNLAVPGLLSQSVFLSRVLNHVVLLTLLKICWFKLTPVLPPSATVNWTFCLRQLQEVMLFISAVLLCFPPFLWPTQKMAIFLRIGDRDYSGLVFFFLLSQVNIWPFTFTEEFPHMSAQRISLDDSLWISFHVSWKWIMIGLERRKSSWVFRRWFPGFPQLAICHSIFTHAMGPVSMFQVELVSAWLKLICFKLKFLNFSNQKQLR